MIRLLRFPKLISAVLLLSSVIVFDSVTLAQPQYASAKTKEVIDKMIIAHGGMQKWREAKTLSFDNIFFNPLAGQMQWPSPWWVSHEVVDLKNRRAYHDWPLDQAQLAYDGEKVWTIGWKIANMPKFAAMFFFYFVSLPWLTQDANVRLGELDKGKLPGFAKDYFTVAMGFTAAPTIGKTANDSYKLYIDPDTYLLQAYEYSLGFGALLDAMGLPADQEVFGPLLRIHDRFITVGGLTVPAEMHTMAPDGSQTYGHHIVFNYSFNEAFDEARMKMPAAAVIDQSRPERQQTRK
ncbi:hypothetical protein L0337_05515 [candidate division KSB1 bacterium]|nr:hypothetical protein [candidate division KSB1 bacterium]